MKTAIKSTIVAVALAGVVALPATAAELQAPFGLEWGQTQVQLRQQGIQLHACREGHDELEYVGCEAKNLSKSLGAEWYYFPSFVRSKLQQVSAIIPSQTKEQFDTLKARLVKKYGKPSELINKRLGVSRIVGAKWNINGATITLGHAILDDLFIRYESKEYNRLKDESKHKAEKRRDESKAKRQQQIDDADL